MKPRRPSSTTKAVATRSRWSHVPEPRSTRQHLTHDAIRGRGDKPSEHPRSRKNEHVPDEKKYAGLTPTGLQNDIHDILSRVASPEWARYMAAHEDLKLLNTKGRDYDNMIGEKVLVTYNEQDAEGYEQRGSSGLPGQGRGPGPLLHGPWVSNLSSSPPVACSMEMFATFATRTTGSGPEKFFVHKKETLCRVWSIPHRRD